MRISAWSSDVCSSDLDVAGAVEAVRAAAHVGEPLAVMGARHAMGGQQFLSGGRVLDLGALDRVTAFDDRRGLVTVEAGIRWPALLAWLAAHPGNARGWTIRQKQTGADDFSLGGALASNIHRSEEHTSELPSLMRIS